jgi:spermidine synthase
MVFLQSKTILPFIQIFFEIYFFLFKISGEQEGAGVTMTIRYREDYAGMKGFFGFEVNRVLFSQQSPFQKIDILDTDTFGKVLLIDNLVMFTEKDEFVYHEMIAHVPLFVHPGPKNILVIGGGDGGTIRECLKHPEILAIDLVEIDQLVAQACLKYTPYLSEGILNEKVNCCFEDAVRFVKQSKNRYDIILVDSTDPINVGEGLFTREFYKNCYKLLTSEGILVAQSETPFWTPGLISGIAKKLKTAFSNVHFYQVSIPTYPSGCWSFVLASKKYHPVRDFRMRRYRELNLKLKYYNDALHSATFNLPTFFRELSNGN